MNKYGMYAQKIARLLNDYPDLLQQLDSITDGVFGIDYSATKVMGGSVDSGGSTANLAVRRCQLEERCRRVETLLDSLSDGEKIAAQWWINTGTTQEEIAHRLGIHRNTAGPLIRAIPMILAMRNMHLLETS